MDFTQAFKEVDRLKEEFDAIKVNTEFEKNKLKYILGEELYDSFKQHNVMVAGGTITSLFTNSDINDIDIYFRNKDDLASFIMDICKTKYLLSSTSKATLFRHIFDEGKDSLPIQLIHFKYFDNPKEIFNTFDFTVCMGAFDFSTEEFVLHNDFLKHNSQKILKFNQHTSFPLISMIRTNKYQDKGYSISRPEVFKILLASINLEINSYEELEDQLAGMYGEAYDELLADVDKDAEVDLPMVIERIGNIHLTEKYFTRIDSVVENYSSIEDLVYDVTGIKRKYFYGYKGIAYVIDFSGDISRVGNSYVINENKHKYEEVDAKDVIDAKYYKFVEKIDGKYCSFYDNDFKYIPGEWVKGKDGRGLYLNDLDDIGYSTYSDETNKVLIEVEVDPKELIQIGTTKQFLGCKMIREVPENEWNKEKQKEQEDCDEDFLDLD